MEKDNRKKVPASLLTMNLDITNDTNDNIYHVSKCGEQAQVTVEEVIIKKKKRITLDEEERNVCF